MAIITMEDELELVWDLSNGFPMTLSDPITYSNVTILFNVK